MIKDKFYNTLLITKKTMNENVDNSRLKRSFSNFNDDLTKTLEKTFQDFYNDFDETLFFNNENDTSSTTSYK